MNRENKKGSRRGCKAMGGRKNQTGNILNSLKPVYMKYKIIILLT